MTSPWRPIPSFHLPDLRGRNVLSDNLPAEIHKGLVNVCPPPCACFVVGRVSPALGDPKCARAGDCTVFFEVAFVADNDEWDALVVFNANDLVTEFVEFGEGGKGGDGEDEEETLTGFHVEFSVRKDGLSAELECGNLSLIPHSS